MDDGQAFGRLVESLRPWHTEIVFVGGWAHRLHRLHPLARTPEHAPITTADADVAIPDPKRITGDIRSALLDAGFDETLTSDHAPPVSEYRLDGAGGFYAEFLAPLMGSPRKRDGRERATERAAGVSAQLLRHLDLLLVAPWSIALVPNGPVAVSSAATILIPNAVAFIAQRLVIRSQRPAAKRAQDVLYVHDTLELFGGAFGPLAALWADAVRPHVGARLLRTLRDEIVRYDVLDDDVREAARIANRPDTTPERMRARIAYGLGQVMPE